MIVADRKPLTEILTMIEAQEKILIVGCKGCVTVCNTGGLKEVEILASSLGIARKKENRPLTIDTTIIERQCDNEYVEQLRDKVNDYDAVLSMACGVGPQFLSEAYPGQKFYPAVNTTFYGGAVAHGIWEERCAGCGTCIIHDFEGLCPIARCAKSLLHGPCGGSSQTKCEINPDTQCIWDHIVARKMELGKLEDLMKVRELRDWRSARDGGPRQSIREELTQ
ncbi:Methylene-tetrahydrofolate reductase C terminal [Desulfocicer vacuolatum DSM 3385]|uniref:Methylene-tetrahydrofolate reductase C terminal n=1 Tax=Desulfocicer vacuolatum DSM 3385 TaxID=1121400 RepID=A0A1W2B8A0_9BACT|nr:methylenetetrahydrofolate reductase C-terminal domain-containing protein [Desulfocicer vacuolatum]SMC69156.1 Methylene-tetrahydrofolate reductase C terminal [Desulfocicer vacuolatum DSM 3385]